MDNQINVLALVKGDQHFIFLYDEANRVETLRTLGRFAADPDIDFSWHDAAFMSQRIRDLAYRAAKEQAVPPEEECQPIDVSKLALRRRFSLKHEEDLL
ncbi:MAG: hypothetical protein KatS3mg111_2589 [Pirellulaceae bacterium]|nr:MAG: hypothetical protein KatS3mg111_2589 [Pirellulaceae bacterium]